MTKEELIKDNFPNDEFLQSAVSQIVDKCTAVLEEENKKLKKRFSHNCPSCVAFGKHCPHKVNGDPYFYDCYLTVKELEKEYASLKGLRKYELNVAKLEIEKLEKENEKLKIQNTNAKEILRSLYFIIQGRIDYTNNVQITDEMWRAEQFLKQG